MFRLLVKTAEIEIEGHSFALHYFQHRTARGARRYSCEVMLGSSDRIILDDDSLASLEAQVTRLAPATVSAAPLPDIRRRPPERRRKKDKSASGKPPLVGAARGR